ncbi:MAG TPA: glycosyltransferase family 2 protein [Steroidobacteraceae bacterium]|nr:glycosyltransferase family 2 protein [Steroidobacteraceae bacterium]
MIRACAVIPYFEHPQTLGVIVAALRRHGLDCWIVDDGSGPTAHAVAQEISEREPGAVRLLTHATNRGKGAAVLSGCRTAAAAGYTHALQVDADGQHDLEDIPLLLSRASQHQQALILAVPRFGDSMPRSRRFGRHITHFWVWIHTLSLEVADSMCGFRVYPLAPLLALAASERLGERMDFDTEVVVRLHWRGTRIIEIPTVVLYPRDGVSHFRLWRDNVLISRMHARLFFGMLRRFPRLIARRFRNTRHA